MKGNKRQIRTRQLAEDARAMLRRALDVRVSPALSDAILDLYSTLCSAVARGDSPDPVTLNCWSLLVEWYGREAMKGNEKG